jgi:prepilin-type N-terminal cleavage/methylation domain-containing protein
MIILINKNKLKKFFNHERMNDGFSLIEIITVIFILGVILAAIYPFLNAVNRWGGVSQNYLQEFEDRVNNYFLAISDHIRNANAIEIYDSGDTIEIEVKDKNDISKVYRYEKNGNSIDVIVNESSTKKIIPEIPNITFDDSVPLFNDINNDRKKFELSVKVNYSIGSKTNSKLFTTSVTKRNNN